MFDSSLEEGLAATYLRALQADCFDFYRHREEPFRPCEIHEAILKHLDIKNKYDRGEAWREIVNKDEWKGYFKACDDVQAANSSDEHFLIDMLFFFEAHDMSPQIEIVRERLLEFPDHQKHYEAEKRLNHAEV